MKYEFICVAIDPEEIHEGSKLVAEWRTVTLMARNVGGNGKGGAVGGFQLPLMEVDAAGAFEVGKSYSLSIEPA
jgi:hypothetical protein